MKKIFLFLACMVLPSLALASVSIEESDFIQRVINFVIFVAILWYFAFDSIKGIFTNRTKSISAHLQEVQECLQKAKLDREAANKKLEASKEKAKEIVNAAKQEAYNIEQRYNEMIKRDIEILKHTLEVNMEFECRKAIQEGVDEVLSALVKNDDIRLNKEDYVNIISKRISS